MLTEGFHQPILGPEQLAKATPEALRGQLQLLVAPNPVHAILYIKIRSDLEGKAVIDLWTLQGRLLKRAVADLSQADMQWDMTPFPSAVYVLALRNAKGELLQTYKVTKTE